MGKDVVEKLLAQLVDLDRKVSVLLAERDFDSTVPLPLSEAAEICHVERGWLLERIQRKEIPAYRNGGGTTPWRVFPKDIRSFLMQNNNQQPVRRRSVLRKAS